MKHLYGTVCFLLTLIDLFVLSFSKSIPIALFAAANGIMLAIPLVFYKSRVETPSPTESGHTGSARHGDRA